MNLFSPVSIHRCLPESSLERLRRGDALAAAIAALFLTGLAFYLFPQSEKCPVEPYRLFAQNPFSFREFPYGARMATPVLVGLFWENVDAGFRAVAFASFFLCGTLLAAWLRLIGVSLKWALALLPVFYFASTARFIIANPWYIDPMSYWLLVSAFIGITTGNIGIAMASIALGALNRPESLSIVFLLAIAWFRKDRPIASLITAAACALPGIALALAMRIIWPLVSDCQVWQQIGGGNLANDPQPYSIIFVQQGFKELLNPLVYRETLPCLWGLAVIGFFQAVSRIRWLMLAQILLAVLPIVIATDYFRLPFYVFPAVILLSALGFQALARIHVLFACGAAAMTWVLTAFAPKSIPGGMGLAIALLIAWWVLRKKVSEEEETTI